MCLSRNRKVSLMRANFFKAVSASRRDRAALDTALDTALDVADALDLDVLDEALALDAVGFLQ
jgi:hypothetical protein